MPRSLLAAVSAVAVALLSLTGPAARADETTIGYSPLRTNWDDDEPRLGPDAVGAADFGSLWDVTLPRPDGQTADSYPNQVYAQPLVAGGLVIVATEENQVDALDPATGALVWSDSLGTPWTAVDCGDLVPHVGITSTPVYDPDTHAVYVVAKTDDGSGPGGVHIRLHSLDVGTGAERAGFPVEIQGTATNTGEVFDPYTSHQRTGLLLMGGTVYFGTASHCDHGAYVGYVVGVTTAGGTPVLWSSESGAADSEAGIWQSGGGLMSDGAGRIFVATGNGISPPPGPGADPPGTLAESVVRLGVNGDGTLTAHDFFSPANNTKLDQDDADLGSGSPVALPDDFGSAAHPHLLVIAGKDGVVWLLDRDDLGGNAQGPRGHDLVVSTLHGRGVWGRAAAFTAGSGAGAKHYLYLLPSTAPMQAIQVAPNASGVPTMSIAGATDQSFAFGSGSPVVTSDGTDPATALVWVVTLADRDGSGAMLQAWPAAPPTAAPWHPIWSAPLGTAAKFLQPATDGGRVFVATKDGRVLAFGRPTKAAVTTPPTDFGLLPVGDTATKTVTLTAHRAVTVTAVTASGPFTAGAPDPALPATLDDGQSVTVPVTFAPISPGATTGVLHVTADGDPYSFSLNGTGTQDGLLASPPALEFAPTSVGQGAQLGVTIQNTGTTPATITGVDSPGAPFHTDGLPGGGDVIAPQESVSGNVLFQPTAAGEFEDQLVITADTGSVTIPLQGDGFIGAPKIKISPAQLDFGSVPPGTTRSLAFVVKNAGTATMEITKAAPPSPPFSVPAPIGEGTEVAPGDQLTVTVKLTARTALPLADAYSITAAGTGGARSLPIVANTRPPQGTITSAFGCMHRLKNRDDVSSPLVSHDCIPRSPGWTAEHFSKGANDSLRYGPSTSLWCAQPAERPAHRRTAIELGRCRGGEQQRWRWTTADEIVHVASGLCVTVRHGDRANNTPLVLATCVHKRRQIWDESPLHAQRGEVSAGVGAVGQLCLADPSGAIAAASITLDACDLSAVQIFTYSAHTLRVAGGCVTAAAGKAGAVTWTPCTGTPDQTWTWRPDRSLFNPAGRLCLDDPHSSTTPGTAVQTWTCNGTPAQRWQVPARA